MVIISLDNFKIKELKKLQNKKYRDIHDKFLIEGNHLIEEAYKSGLLLEILVEESYDIDIDVQKTFVSKKVIKYLSELETPSNVIGICKKKEEIEKLEDTILVLDNIQDPGNLGTIVRSSCAFNATLVISEDTVDIYNDKTIRSSQGMLFKVNVLRRNIEDFINEIKNEYTIYGTDVNGGTNLSNIKKNYKSVIIIGNEGQGISDQTRDLCDSFIYISMNSNCESLNASVAASIILYEFSKE